MDENKTEVEVQETEEKKSIFAKAKDGLGRAGKFVVNHLGDAAKIAGGIAAGFAISRVFGGAPVVGDDCYVDDESETEADDDAPVDDVD